MLNQYSLFPGSGPKGDFHAYFNKQFAILANRINKIEDKLLLILSSPGQVTNSAVLRRASFWINMRKQIEATYTQFASAFSSWTDKEIPAIYKRSMRNIASFIETNKAITATAQQTLNGILGSSATEQIVAGLISDANTTYAAALNAGQNNMLRITRATQQAIISERIVDATVAEAFNLGNLRKARSALTGIFNMQLLDAAADKQFVQAGRYKYRPSYYAELVTRTKFHDAQSYAAMNQARNYGTDLLQISSHNTKTAICLPYEGRIFSISGKDLRFPRLEDIPPFHPNCLHLSFPTFESAMEVEGTLDSFSAFSRGRIEKPPIPANFIPASNRDIA